MTVKSQALEYIARVIVTYFGAIQILALIWGGDSVPTIWALHGLVMSGVSIFTGLTKFSIIRQKKSYYALYTVAVLFATISLLFQSVRTVIIGQFTSGAYFFSFLNILVIAAFLIIYIASRKDHKFKEE